MLTEKGVFFLLHGWAGSIQSSYMIRTTRYFYKLGFRLIPNSYLFFEELEGAKIHFVRIDSVDFKINHV
ncbi:MAG: hypothetical protein O9264_08035 [Leptospira sp.]|nr:hypothetical protein [Leptospira sp.]